MTECVCVTCGKPIEDEDAAWELYDGSPFCDHSCSLRWEHEHVFEDRDND